MSEPSYFETTCCICATADVPHKKMGRVCQAYAYTVVDRKLNEISPIVLKQHPGAFVPEYVAIEDMQQLCNTEGQKVDGRFGHMCKDRKMIQYRPASQCHAIGARFGAAQTERGNAQKRFAVSGRAVTQNYFARGAIQNRTSCSCFTTSVKIPPMDSKDVKGS